jgi:hypothetical protein
MAITNTRQAKKFTAGAPNIMLKGDLRPLNTMAYGGRAQYGLGSFVKSIGKGVKKAVKGVAKGVKNVAKSDLGKTVLGAAALYYAPALFQGTPGFGPGSTYRNFFGNLSLPGIPGLSEKGAGTLKAFAIGSLGSAALSAAEAGGLDSSDPNAEVDIESLQGYLSRGYKNLNPNATDEEVFQFVQENTAEYRSIGGRIGYDNGGSFTPAQQKLYDMGMSMLKGNPSFEEYLRERQMIEERMRREQLEKDYKEDLRRKKVKQQKQEVAEGGRIGYAMGDTASENAMQAAGIEGLPIRQNKAGVTELDLRETGGFVPPVGVKEKADDIPAMLSNNEFVFTADAVRAAGGGNMNKGAQIMYDTMKQLESRVV